MNYIALGQKIRTFRKRSGISQLDLEIEIGASAGSLSRIENGEVNPSKETIIKIIDTLNLNAKESASLFGIKMDDRYGLISKSAAALNSNLNLDYVLQISVDDIVNRLDLLAGFITLIKGNILQAQTTTRNNISRVSMKFLPKRFTDLKIPITKDSQNLCVRAVLEKRIIIDNEDMAFFLVPVISHRTAKLLKKVTGAKAGIVLPIFNKTKTKVLGTIFFGKNYIDDFANEIEILELYAEHVGIAIENAKSYMQLQNKIIKLNEK